MDDESVRAITELARLLRERRRHRPSSQRQLADAAGLDPAVVSRIERGRDARLSIWVRLFAGLGYRLLFDVTELSEEANDLIVEEFDRRLGRRLDGLWTGRMRKWR